MNRLILLLAILVAVCAGTGSAAATYYVSQSGSDVSGGGTLLKPWRSMAKAESTAFRGDTVNVAAGTYIENNPTYGCLSLAKGITWKASGVVRVRPVKGAVAVRILTGTDAITMQGFTLEQNLTSISANYVLYIENCAGKRTFTSCSFLTSGAYLVRLQTCGIIEFNACAFTGGSGLMIFSTDANLVLTNCTFTGKNSPGLLLLSTSSRKDVALTGGQILGSYTNDIILNTGNSNLTVSNMNMTLTAGAPSRLVAAFGDGKTGGTAISDNTITASIPMSDSLLYVAEKSSAVRISGNTVSLTNPSPTSHVIDLRGQFQPEVLDNYIETTTTNPVTHISVRSDGKTVGAALIRGNACKTRSLAGYAMIIGTDGSGLGDNMVDGAVIEFNRIFGPVYHGVSGTVTLHGILFGHSRYARANHNYVNGAGYGIIFKGTGQDWRYDGGASNNIFVNCSVAGGYAKGVRNTSWSNNTCFLGADAVGVALMEAGANVVGNSVYEATGTKLRYNILCGRGGSYMVAIMSTGSIVGLDSDHNCVWNGGGNDGFYVSGTDRSLSQWQSLGQDKHSVVADPMFENTGLNDFRLRPTSPCINPDSTGCVNDSLDSIYLPQFSYGALQPIPAAL